MKKLTDDSKWRAGCTHVVKGSQMPWEDTRMGRLKYLVHPKIATGLVTYEAWIQEIPPGRL